MNNITSVLFTSLLTVGCIGGDDAQPAPSKIANPRTCAEAAQGFAVTSDGERTLYVDADPSRPWSAYCSDGNEYLTLPRGGDMNWSMYRAGGRAAGTDVITRFDKVRIDPLTFQLDISDQTFAMTEGALVDAGGTAVTAMPLGVAMTCGGGYATANINVADTPFWIEDRFALGGDTGRAGHAELWSTHQVVEMWADGDCGWIAPSLAPASPFNSAGGYMISLTYQK